MSRYTNHPDWYYKYYDKVFSKEKNYYYEIEQIDAIVSLAGKKVQEVGSGTGEHAIRILAKNPSYLELLDFNRKAINILEGRFKEKNNVKILYENGFGDTVDGIFDVVICMYSIIVQSIETFEELENRLKTIFRRIRKGGYLFFETIDYDICKTIYKEGSQSNIYKNANDEVIIKTEYSENKINFIYSGKLDNQKISYKVSLFNLNKKQLLDFFTLNNISDNGFISLDKSNRRQLIFARI